MTRAFRILVYACVVLACGAALAPATAHAQQSPASGRKPEKKSQIRKPGMKSNDQYDETFRKYSKRFFGPGFDWQYFKAQAMAESNLQASAKSHVGARGLMQLMPSTYAEIKSNSPELRAIDDPESNIAAGIMYDRDLWKRYKDHEVTDERLRFTFAGYNSGPGTINRAKRTACEANLDDRTWSNVETIAPKVQRWRYRETLGYVRKIEAFYAEMSRTPSKVNAVKKQ